MTLVLQTNIAGRLAVWLVDGGRIIIARRKAIVWHSSDKALALVDRTIRQAKRSLREVHKIVVVRGPGPFTAVRTGLIIANTLGMLLKIPVRGVVTKHQLSNADVLRDVRVKAGLGKIVKPWYGKSPNISTPKNTSRQAKERWAR
ncbi:MAG: hypothetical protein AAB619_00880 [Patescibacteria group bacterium]